MKVTIEHHSGRLEDFVIPSPDEIRAFKDALQPIVEFFSQDLDGPQENPVITKGIPKGLSELPCEGLVPEEVPVETDEAEALGVTVENPRCFLCGDIIETDDAYCYGCRTFICPEHPQAPWGRHRPDKHDEP